jgi:uncharacterized protein YndB with AHSA1/START domain
MTDRVVTAERVVAAPPAAIFALLRDPSEHAEIDGSGTVKASRGDTPPLELGSKFSMSMRMGMPYVIKNTVVEYEPDRLIAWRHFGRHIWRWELQPVDGGTRVTESFDYRRALSPWMYERLGFPQRNADGIEKTLDDLVARFGGPPVA